MMTYLLFMQRF